MCPHIYKNRAECTPARNLMRSIAQHDMAGPTTDIEQPGDDIAKYAFDHVEPTIGQDAPSPKKSGNFNAVLAGGLGMLSDGYQVGSTTQQVLASVLTRQNSLLSTSNVLFKKIYGSEYSNTYAGQIANGKYGTVKSEPG